MATKSRQLQIRVTDAQKTRVRRLAKAAGQEISAYVLSRVLPAESARFAELIRGLRQAADRRFWLAELNGFLTGLAPVEFPEAVARADLAGLSPLDRNYVAALVEQAAARNRVAPPEWVAEVPPLVEPYFATTLRSLRPHLLRAAPVAFKRRNLFVDTGLGGRV
jgi:hypothetical protein